MIVNNLLFLNKSKTPTIETSFAQSNIDLTISNRIIVNFINNWEIQDIENA
jgi:hypothetical protein